MFNPDNFDVDVFIVDDNIASLIPKNKDGHRILGRLSQYQALSKSLSDSLKQIPGHRTNKPVQVFVYNSAEYADIARDVVHMVK